MLIVTMIWSKRKESEERGDRHHEGDGPPLDHQALRELRGPVLKQIRS